MRYLSLFSGIEAASVAWIPLGWQAIAFAEVDRFASAVLSHWYPETPNWGDVNRFKVWPDAAVDLLVGGSPCQSFSVAGLRQGMDDPRGNLALVFLAVADRYRPKWIVYENVPGLLSSNSGRDFGSFLGGLAQLGYGFSYRVLDAQHFGVPQRRRRVFVVGHLGDWRPAAAVLFEREGLRWDSAPSREAGQGVARPIAGSSARSSGYRNDADTAENLIAFSSKNTSVNAGAIAETLDVGAGRGHGSGLAIAFGGNNTAGPIDVATAVNAHGGPHGRLDFESETFIAHTLRADGFDASEDETGRGTPIVPAWRPGLEWIPCRDCGMDGCQTCEHLGYVRKDWLAAGVVAFSSKDYGADAGDLAPTLRAMGHDGSHANAGGQVAVAFNLRGREDGAQPESDPDNLASIRAASGGSSRSYVAQSAVRRLTPRECERLQGLPDDYTLIPWRGGIAPDGPRYKAIGNSIAVPCLRWIGERIMLCESVQAELARRALRPATPGASMTTEKRKQVAAQCRVVSHLAKTIAEVHDAKAALFEDGHMDGLIDMVGRNTASLMETLGDILNGMDAVTKEDKWTEPVFAEAHRLWPQKPSQEPS